MKNKSKRYKNLLEGQKKREIKSLNQIIKELKNGSGVKFIESIDLSFLNKEPLIINSWLSYLITIIWFSGITNAINWMERCFSFFWLYNWWHFDKWIG